MKLKKKTMTLALYTLRHRKYLAFIKLGQRAFSLHVCFFLMSHGIINTNRNANYVDNRDIAVTIHSFKPL